MKGMKKLPRWARTVILTVGIAAVVGGAVFGGLSLARSRQGGVKVYPAGELAENNIWASQSETQGLVTTDKIQSVYITSTQKITELYVSEGDRVCAGDPILSFDTTLTDLELERQGIKVQQLGLDLEEAKRDLCEIKSYKVYTPPADDPVEPAPLPSVPVPYLRTGSGSGEDPYRYVWNDSCSYSPDFVNSILPPLPEDFDPETGELPAVSAVFEVRECDSLMGGIFRSWQINFRRIDDGGYTFSITEPVPEPLPPPDDPAQEEPVDNSVYLPWATIQELRAQAEKRISDLELEIKKAQLQYDTLQYELDNGIVTASIDGVVKTIRSSEEALEEGKPLLLISGGGGYYVTGTLGELELSSLRVGDTVSVTSWENYSTFDGVITEISEYPDTTGAYHYSQGNNNVTLYPFTVFLDEDSAVREGEWVNITYNTSGEGGGVYLSNAFIRQENGQRYVMAANAEGRLEKRYLATGRTLWGSETEILAGLSEKDYIAFPYGRSVKEGARTTVADVSSLYAYY